MKILLLLLILPLAHSWKNCHLLEDGEITPMVIDKTIDDDDTTFNILFEHSNVGDVDFISTYFEANFESATGLELKLSPNYANIEEEYVNKEAPIVISLQFNVNCVGETTIEVMFIKIEIVDKNQNNPEFLEASYEYLLPLPYPIGVPVSLFGNEIIARDIDISNTRISFQIVPDDVFEVTSELDKDDNLKKNFVAKVKTKIPITQSMPVDTFTITAFDKDDQAGTPVTIKLIADESNSLPASPKFTNPFYSGKYIIEDSGDHTLTLEDIKIDQSDNIDVTLGGDHQSNFNLVFDSTDKSVTITVKDPLANDIIKDNLYINLVVTATNTKFDIPATSANVLVELPAEDPLPTEGVFEESLYLAKYDEGTVILSSTISVTAVDVTITMDDAYDEFFRLDSSNLNEIKIAVDNELTQTILDENQFLTIKLNAKNLAGNDVGKTNVVIELPEKQLPPVEEVFEQSLYLANYKDEEEFVSLTSKIIVTATDVTITMDNTYGEFFSLDLNDLSDIKIKVDNALTQDILDDNAFLTIKLNAKNIEDENVGETNVVIELPEKEQPPVDEVFVQSLYLANYKDKIVTLTSKIVVTATDVTITMDNTYAEFLSLNVDELSDIKIRVDKALTQDILDDNAFLTIKLSAKNVAGENVGGTNVVIELPEKDQPPVEEVFEQSLYLANYKDDTVTLTSKITVTDTDVTITMDNIYEQYFGLETNDLTDIKINVIEKLPQSILDEKQFLPLKLSAVRAGNVAAGSTNVVIELPKSDTLPAGDVFELDHYTAEYTIKDDLHNLVLTAPIKLINDKVTQLTLKGDTSKYFNIEFNTAKDEAIITIKDKLTEDILNDEIFLILNAVGTISADADSVGQTVIVIGLPTGEDDPNPETTIKLQPIAMSLKSGHVGFIIDMIAEVTPIEEIEYSLSGSPSWLELTDNKLSVKDGSILIPGVSKVVGIATGKTSGAISTASIVFYVETVSVCDREPVTDYTILAKEIKEEEANDEIVPLNPPIIEDKVFEYQIVSQIPDNNWIKIKEIGGNVFLSSDAIDREHTTFKDFLYPQVTVTLELIDVTRRTSSIHSMFKRQQDVFQQCLMIDREIRNLARVMTVPIIITDINDKTPVFEKPSITVGYPTKDIVAEINPQYITKVEATDEDSEENAIITYSVNNKQFIIDEKEGILYATEGIYSGTDKLDLVISAFDKVNTGKLNMKVLLLDEDYISVILLKNLKLSDLEAKLADLSTKAKVSINTFTSSVVPVQKSSDTRAAGDYYLSIVAYALDGDVAVSASDLKSKLAGEDLSIEQYSPPSKIIVGDDSDSDDTALIAGIVVLTVLLVIVIAGFGAFYYFRLRRSNISLDLEHLPDSSTAYNRKNTTVVHTDIDSGEKPTRRATQYPFAAPVIDDDDDDDKDKDSDSGDEFGDAKDRRKSVTFNEKIQNFAIEKEGETDSTKNAEDSSSTTTEEKDK